MPRRLDSVRQRVQRQLDAGMVGVSRLVQMDLCDAIVVEAERLAKGVLGNLQTAVHVAAEGRGEVKPDGERKVIRAQGVEQGLPVQRARAPGVLAVPRPPCNFVRRTRGRGGRSRWRIDD